MHDHLGKDELRELIEYQDDTCISIFMPTQAVRYEEQAEARIRLRNMIDKATEEVKAFAPHLRLPEVKRLMAPARKLLRQGNGFRRHQSDGLAIFLAEASSRVYRVPLTLDEFLFVGKRFYIRPLLPLLGGDRPFYILSLSQNSVRLFQATRYMMEEIELTGVPTSLAEALAYDDFEKELQFRSSGAAPGVAGARPVAFYSHETVRDRRKEELLRFCQQIDQGLHARLRSKDAPLVLACVDYLCPIYRQANSYVHLLLESVSGSPDRWPPSELHQKAWQLVEPHLSQSQRDALHQYERLAGTKLVSTEIEIIVLAAHAGRVAALFVTTTDRRWGRFDRQIGQLEEHESAAPGDEELLDLAAVHTLLNAGEVYALPREEMPRKATMAAIFRY